MAIDKIVNIDQILFQKINLGMSNPFFDSLMPIITKFGSLFFWTVIAGYLILKKKVAGATLGLGLLINSVIIFVVKNLVARGRPETVLEGINTLLWEGDFSFPSGHTSTAFVGAVIMGHYFPKYKPVFYSLAGLVALSRVYIGVHYPLDVLVGVAIGALVGKVVLQLPVTKYSKKYGFVNDLRL
jgi:undecaprenyl-diphosphatase